MGENRDDGAEVPAGVLHPDTGRDPLGGIRTGRGRRGPAGVAVVAVPAGPRNVLPELPQQVPATAVGPLRLPPGHLHSRPLDAAVPARPLPGGGRRFLRWWRVRRRLHAAAHPHRPGGLQQVEQAGEPSSQISHRRTPAF